MDIEDIDWREVLRYLGYGRHEVDQTVMNLAEECIAQLLKKAQPRCLYREYSLILGPEDAVNGGCFQAVSRNLSRNLRDCGQIIVFTTTLGTGTDHLIQEYSKLQMSRAMIMQAVATAMIEEYCDRACTGIKEEYESGDRYLRPRFSPGYGGFPPDRQQRLSDGLEMGERIGIKLTNSPLMILFKLMTAVVGVSKKPYRCNMKGCESCGKKDCLCRRWVGDEWESWGLNRARGILS